MFTRASATRIKTRVSGLPMVSLGLLSRDVHDLTPIVNEGPGRLSYDGCAETIILRKKLWLLPPTLLS